MGNVQNAAAVAAGRVFHARVLAALGGVMRSRRLRLLGGGPGDVATLYGDRCLVRLRLDADGEVCCTLNDRVRGGEFELSLYLRLMVRERVVLFLPVYMDEGGGNVTDAWLGGVAAALGDKVMDGPLSGDFSWAMDYRLLYEEAFTVGEELLPVLRRGGRELRELGWLVMAGDPRWVLEGRRVVESGDVQR